MKRKIILYFFVIFMFCSISCSVNRKSLQNDINASLNMDYYNLPKDTKFLYKNKLYSQKDFEQKHNIMSFKEVEIIQDKKIISTFTNDTTCKVILKIIK